MATKTYLATITIIGMLIIGFTFISITNDLMEISVSATVGTWIVVGISTLFMIYTGLNYLYPKAKPELKYLWSTIIAIGTIMTVSAMAMATILIARVTISGAIGMWSALAPIILGAGYLIFKGNQYKRNFNDS